MILDSPETKQQILSQFLELAAFEGWSDETLTKALEKCDIDSKFQRLIFENGCLDVIDFYIEHYNHKSGQLISDIPDFHNLKIRDKIRQSIYARFAVESDNKIVLQRLANFYLDPRHFLSISAGPRPMIQSLRTCYKVADFIWYSIGDQSTDFNFYTKRLTLSKIILRSLLVFLKDEDDDFEKTKRFIDAEIEKVMKFEKFKRKVKKHSSTVKEGVEEFALNESGSLKKPHEIFKSLPFIRLFKT